MESIRFPCKYSFRRTIGLAGWRELIKMVIWSAILLVFSVICLSFFNLKAAILLLQIFFLSKQEPFDVILVLMFVLFINLYYIISYIYIGYYYLLYIVELIKHCWTFNINYFIFLYILLYHSWYIFASGLRFFLIQ